MSHAPLTRREIENYLMDAMGLSASDFDEMTLTEMRLMLQEAGELKACYDYNGINID